MLRHIDARNGIPIYEQIIRQVTIAVADGSLAAIDRVTRVRWGSAFWRSQSRRWCAD